MLQPKNVLPTIVLALCCSTSDADVRLERVAEFSYPREGAQRFTGGREVEFIEDGTKMIVEFYGCSVQIFDLENREAVGEPLRTAGDGEVGFVNNKIAYTSDWDSLRLWNPNSGQQVGDAIPHELREDSIIHPAIDDSGRFVATRANMKSVQLWDVTTWIRIAGPRNFSSVVQTLQFSDDGELLFVTTGGSLYAIDSKTGEEVAGPIASGWRFKHFEQQHRLITTERHQDGSYQLVIRRTDREKWPEIYRTDLPGRLTRMLSLSDDQVLVQASRKDYTPAIMIVDLEKPDALAEVESNADRAFGLVVSGDGKTWVSSNLRDITCRVFGQSEPVWQKQVPVSGYDHQLYSFDDDHFLVRDKQENLGLYKYADGSEVWNQAGVRRFRVRGNTIALCSRAGVEVWGAK